MPSAMYEVKDEVFKTNGQMIYQIVALDFVYAVLQMTMHNEMLDIMIRSERVPCQRKQKTQHHAKCLWKVYQS